MVTRCEVKRLLRTCGQPGVAVCQYCGRSFCGEHGGRLPDGQEICSRSTCLRKKTDLEHHFRYREAVAVRNRERRCGEPSCRAGAAGQCSKCDGLFCLAHLEDHELEEQRGHTTVRHPASLCRHCRARRNLWSRV